MFFKESTPEDDPRKANAELIKKARAEGKNDIDPMLFKIGVVYILARNTTDGLNNKAVKTSVLAMLALPEHEKELRDVFLSLPQEAEHYGVTGRYEVVPTATDTQEEREEVWRGAKENNCSIREHTSVEIIGVPGNMNYYTSNPGTSLLEGNNRLMNYKSIARIFLIRTIKSRGGVLIK